MRSESSYHKNQLPLSKQESAANEMSQKTLNVYLKDVNHLMQDANTTVEKMSIPTVIIGKDFRRKHDFEHPRFQAHHDPWLDISRGFIQR